MSPSVAQYSPFEKRHAQGRVPAAPQTQELACALHVGKQMGWAHNDGEQQMDTAKTHGATGATLDKRETYSLIASDKVEGTPVYRSDGEPVGRIERLMIDKYTGTVAYAVMSFGGFMGIGEDYYPLPWSVLKYNPSLGGYEVNISDEQLRNAPKFSKHENWDWDDRSRGQRVYDYYGAHPFWGS
jgi:hypothetical protein